MRSGPWNLLILRNTGNVLFNNLLSNLVNIWVLIRDSIWIMYGRSYSFHEWTAGSTDGNHFSGNEFISLLIFKRRKPLTCFRVKHRSSQITNLMSENNRILLISITSKLYPCCNQELHWLPIEYRVVFIKINLVTFKCLHDSAPCHLQERLETHKPARSLRALSRLR